jgi:uncharacterized phage protein gp47/JayE
MTLPVKTINQLVADMISTWSGQVGVTPVFQSGDALLAFWQSFAGQLDFLQALIKIVLNITRASTSTGADLDSWMAQFNFTRLVATAAATDVLFGKNLPATQAIPISVGSIVQTQGGAYKYVVVADTSQPGYLASQNAYILVAGATSVMATVQAVVPGAASNVVTGAINQFGTSIPGIDTVTNGQPVENGFDAESDANFRSRFQLYLATLAKATKAAITAAALGVQQGLSVNLLENQRPDGTTLLGSFTAVVDDGSGSPPNSVITAVYQAVDSVRAFSVQPFVTAPTVVYATITLAVRLTTIADQATTNTAVQNAVVGIVNEKTSGSTLFISDIIDAAKLVDAVIAVRSGVTINGVSADLVVGPSQEIRTVISDVTVTNY